VLDRDVNVNPRDALLGRVYLDYNATTPLDRGVFDKMQVYYSEIYGNASSRDHGFGWDAAEAVEEARSNVAELIHANANEIVFTSSSTESINWALRGLVLPSDGSQAIVGSTEHEAVLETCHLIGAKTRCRIDTLSVDRSGRIDLPDVAVVCKAGQTTFVSLMLANNEIGTIHAVRRFAETAHSVGTVFFSDITQAIGKIPVDVHELGLDLAAFSAHKLYGPKGVGALFIRGGEPKIKLEPLIVGGGHERGLRAGTLNVPGIVGFGEACRIAKREIAEDGERIGKMRDKLESALQAELPDIWINGDLENRLSNTSNIGFRGVDARTLIRDMHDIAVSTKSACSSGSPGPSHVLKAIGLTDDEAYSCIRFSLGRFTTEREIDHTISKVIESVRKLRRDLSSTGL
jgi:cysteine desulfurase